MAEQWSTLPGSEGPDLHIDLDRGDLRRSLEKVLRDAVRTGRLPAGTRLPSTRTLAGDLGVARGTVTQAYEQLVAEGYLTSRQGSGTRAAALISPAHPATASMSAASMSAASTAPAGTAPAGTASTSAAGASTAGASTAAARVQPAARWDFTPGAPDVSAFPRGAWTTATKRVLASVPSDVFGYGDPRGTPALRQALAGYLGRARGVLASPEQIVVCSGYTHALALLTGVLAAGGVRHIGFEDPSLPQHREVVTRGGLAVRGVPVDWHGICVDRISSAAVVVTPAHQYPTGATLDPARRARLADWARDAAGLVIEDDYDGEFRYDRQPVGAVQGLAPGRVVYAGTASKTLAPGLRLAWLAAPLTLIDQIVDLRQHIDRHPSVIDQLVLADMIGSGAYDRHIRQCRLRYRARRDRLVETLRLSAPAIAIRGIAAGLHVLLELPSAGPSEAEVTSLASRRGIAVEGLAGHWIQRGEHPAGLVIGYARPPAHAYEPALSELAALLSDATAA
ncbi:MAG TPA: PLP-dependent aminotransferase family protein [Streptosporangiaceae bacterium]|nr:PLP-dependent aminotransferase family protein [Streptosporangiaceae bacterium]